MEANLRSPASSEMRKTYSGAETWLDLWVRPEDRETVRLGEGPGKGQPGGGGGQGLTKLLNGAVCAPRQLQGHVYPASLVLHPAVGLKGHSGAGSLRDDGHKLGVGWGGTGCWAPPRC